MGEPYEFLFDIVDWVYEVVSQLLSILPNPDPFPEIIDGMTIDAESMYTVAYFWMDQFIDMDAVIVMFGSWFMMFPFAWVIMWLWKVMRVR